MGDRLVDTYRWGRCRLDLGLILLLKLAQMERASWRCRLTAEAGENGLPPIWFIRSMNGAQMVDSFNRMLVEADADVDTNGSPKSR